MDAKELRIGNLVYYRNLPYSKVKKIAIIKPGDIGRVGYDILNCYLPIQLTEEWLLKFYMIKYEGWDGFIFWYKNGEQDLSDRFELMETEQGYESPSGKIIKHVHILQNAYYFHTLTGEELEIN